MMITKAEKRDRDYLEFIRESNRIEGIKDEPNTDQMREFVRFMDVEFLTVSDLKQFVSCFQPDASIRDERGMDVMVGRYHPPPGGPAVVIGLNCILAEANSDFHPISVHHRFESLHPFTDCNGRCGRAIWAWQYRDLSLGFLHRYYYQSLEFFNKDEVVQCLID